MQRNTFTLLQAHSPVGRGSRLPNFFKALGALMLVLMGASQVAWGQDFNDESITLTQQPTNQSSQTVPYAGAALDSPYDTYTKLGNNNSNPQVATPAIGTYDLNGNSAITLNAGALVVSAPGRGKSYPSATLNYRVYLTNTTPVPTYSQVALSYTGRTSLGDYMFENNSASINLLSGLVNGGDYTVEVQYVLNVTTTANGNSTTAPVYDPSGPTAYTVSFYVTPPAVTPAGGTTTWQGVSRGKDANGNPVTLSSDTDWLNQANWTNGVPTAQSNAVIPAKATGSTGTTTVYPILNDPNATYAVNNITLRGNSGSSAAQLVINAATLRVYGNITQPAGGLGGNTTGSGSTSLGVANPQTNSTLILAGANQVVTGQLLVSDIIIAGSGTKSVINVLIPSNILVFRPDDVNAGVIVQSAAQDINNGTVSTVFDTTGNSYIQLVSSSTISTVVGQAETNVSYIKGVTRADRTLVAGVQNKFGNIGLDVTANHSPGNIFVYRVVGDALTGPTQNGATPAVPIKRQFRIRGDDNSEAAATASSTIDVVFHYLDSDGSVSANNNELNGIQESNLTMFRSKVNGAPYNALGGLLNTVDNTVTRNGVSSLTDQYITLGDRTNPLPVSLVAFNAVRSADKALLTWTTATEEDNKGFNVQVSLDGVKFRNLSFVGSTSPNSVQTQNYSYTDTESNKAGTRYYRLEQVDYSGKTSYSPVRAVSFSGVAASSLTIAATPNPFTDQVALLLEGTSTTDGPVSVRIVDMTGRLVRDQQLAMSGASIALGNLSELRSGLYLAKVTLADGTTKTVRIQRQ